MHAARPGSRRHEEAVHPAARLAARIHQAPPPFEAPRHEPPLAPGGGPLHRAILLLGKPASGRRTQARMLEPAPGLVRVRMSDLLHQSARWSTGRGARIQAHLEQGQGPPDEEVVPVLLDHLAALNESGAYTPGQDVLILEGVPRSEAQAELLEAKLAVELVIHLRTDDTELLRERCLSDEPTGKEPGGIAPPDPSGPEARRRDFERRLQVFERDTEPVLDRFPTERILELDAGQAPLRIHRAILERVIPVVESPSHPAVS